MQFHIKLYARFVSAVPPIVKKIQIVIGLAAGSFTAASAIAWPSKLAFVGSFCGYAAAVCAGVVLALQFAEQTVTIFKSQHKTAITKTETTTITSAQN
jgi:hypothetical protein